ncbi:GTP 3',8-cyclase MoaA [Streptomyces sp. B1866]|uniref:GTP 3',8-cyclase MoaA n=1 Tax=Streptomyces sp. B1866 TaxID=3075431 RepID=UPI00288F42CB|nr:GTP 3',8-cyclase MoaA [Streptomyces sp. B1866]MDT3395791.1 GTP 3',8-cyclase MoaA [Streptomyces sp. B1866]
MPAAARHALLTDFAATGRNHPYLTFALNSVCDLDCVFCAPRRMPDYGPKGRPLTVDDYAAIAREAGTWRVRKAHCSGGEPTLRGDILDLLAAIAGGLGPGAAVGMTSHGNLRRGLTVDRLRRAGLTHLNVSLHSLDPRRSAAVMGGGDPARARAAIDVALACGVQVKVNCVLLRSHLRDALRVAALARTLPVAVRLIELQNIGPAGALFPTEFVSEAEVRPYLARWFADAGEVDRTALGVRSPGRYLRPDGWAGSIGFIANTSCATCSDANRIKITPTGLARPCVLRNRDIALKPRLADATLPDAFAHLFRAILERDTNEAWPGVHHVDYDLRWDRVERRRDTPALLPLARAGAAQPCAARAGQPSPGEVR